MLCDVASSFTTSNFWLARTASTCGWYMHPFCSTTTGWLGASNVRSPSPSDTNTITFCNSPFASAITSCAIRGEGCCLAHTGSDAMLIALAAGTLPSNRTLPRTVAPVVVGRGPPALTICGAEMHTATVRAKIKTIFLVFIASPQFQDFANLIDLLESSRPKPLFRRRKGSRLQTNNGAAESGRFTPAHFARQRQRWPESRCIPAEIPPRTMPDRVPSTSGQPEDAVAARARQPACPGKDHRGMPHRMPSLHSRSAYPGRRDHCWLALLSYP